VQSATATASATTATYAKLTVTTAELKWNKEVQQ